MKDITKPLILASNSPRRQELLSQAGFKFEIDIVPIDETFPIGLLPEQVAAYISEEKAKAFIGKHPEKIVLTADTVVILDGNILGKPKNLQEATLMLRSLSGKIHQVITAFSLIENETISTYQDIANVHFKTITNEEIDYYTAKFLPLDKAGAYGIQEWIGMIGVNKIEGSFYTIMGLPIHLVYHILHKRSQINDR